MPIEAKPKQPDTGSPCTSGPLAVALLYDGLCTFEFGIVAEVFGLARPEMGNNWYRFASCAVEEGPLRAHGGFVIQADNGIELLDDADIIIVPGWTNKSIAPPDAICEKLRVAHARGARLVSICSGAYLLAATGLLDGGMCATHWRYADDLQNQFPNLEVDATSLYREHNRVATSAGSAAGIDLLIDIVRQDFGSDAANSVARRLVLPAHRSGGQTQFLERPVPTHQSGEIAPLLDKLRETLDKHWTTKSMAGECNMSLRTFLRRFNEATDKTPGDWLTDERIEAAKALLCEQGLSVETVSASVGFGSAHALRHHFRMKVGVTPTEYRSHFFST